MANGTEGLNFEWYFMLINLNVKSYRIGQCRNKSSSPQKALLASAVTAERHSVTPRTLGLGPWWFKGCERAGQQSRFGSRPRSHPKGKRGERTGRARGTRAEKRGVGRCGGTWGDVGELPTLQTVTLEEEEPPKVTEKQSSWCLVLFYSFLVYSFFFFRLTNLFLLYF